MLLIKRLFSRITGAVTGEGIARRIFGDTHAQFKRAQAIKQAAHAASPEEKRKYLNLSKAYKQK